MAKTGGYLVVRRINWQTDLPIGNPVFKLNINQPVIRLSHEEIRDRYRGFDGWPWPDCPNRKTPKLTEGLVTPDQQSVAQKYYEEVSKLYLCNFVYIQFPNGMIRNPNLPTGFVLVGYDYGYYASEDNYFSSILHEVIYGIHDEMTRYAKLLNENLLLPAVYLGEQLHRTRNELLLDAEACLERDGEVFSPIGIYGRPQIENPQLPAKDS